MMCERPVVSHPSSSIVSLNSGKNIKTFYMNAFILTVYI